jgi:hypothetical protein
MRKEICFCLLQILLIPGSYYTAHAQWYVGISAGWNKNYINSDISNRPFSQYKGKSGFSTGIPVLYQFNSWMGVQAELMYAQKNYQLVRSGYFNGIYENTKNSYLQLPVMAHFIFGEKKLTGFLNIGGYAGYWITSSISGTTVNFEDIIQNQGKDENIFDGLRPYNYNENYPFLHDRDQRWGIGGLLGIGMEYHFNNGFIPFWESRYTADITDQQKNYMIKRYPRRNETINLQIGIKRKISK